MICGFAITGVDPDEDCLGIEFTPLNDRFTGSTRIYAGLKELSSFAATIAGFPTGNRDRRA